MDRTIYFLLYDGRSGSTLLAALLNKYKGICVSRESAFVSRIYSYPYQINTHKQIPKFVLYLFDEFQFCELGLSENEVTASINKLIAPFTREQIIKSIIDLYFYKFGKLAKVWIIKHPPFRYLKRLDNIGYDINYIHIYRDGRAVFNSKKSSLLPNGRRMQSNLIKAARDWKKLNSLYFKIDDEKVLHIKYENLVSDEQKIILKILKRLNLNKADKVVSNSTNDYYSNIGDKQKNLHSNVKSTINPTIATKWKEQLKSYQIYSYERVNKKMLQSLGYKLEYSENKSSYLYTKSSLYLFFSMTTYYLLKVSALFRALLKNRNLLELLNRRFSR